MSFRNVELSELHGVTPTLQPAIRSGPRTSLELSLRGRTHLPDDHTLTGTASYTLRRSRAGHLSYCSRSSPPHRSAPLTCASDEVPSFKALVRPVQWVTQRLCHRQMVGI
jgi:hypothetical protein